MFDGRIRITFVSDTRRTVVVNGTLPYDSAPGGWRASLAQLDTTQAPYGDIVALHQAHCFIPTVSALDLPTSDLFFDVAGTPDAVSLTPFHAIYWAPTNEEHVNISAEEAQWVIDEIDHPTVAVSGAPAAGSVSFLSAAPNPAAGDARLTFAATGDGPCDVRVYALGGRVVRALTAGSGPAPTASCGTGGTTRARPCRRGSTSCASRRARRPRSAGSCAWRARAEIARAERVDGQSPSHPRSRRIFSRGKANPSNELDHP